jgi:hypothetical protein
MPRDIRASRKQDPKPFNAAGGAAGFTAAAGEGEGKKLARFKGRGYTGAPMTPEGWWTPVVIDLAGVKTKQAIPALRQHDHEQIAGHTDAVTVSADGIDFAGPFSGQAEHVAKVLEPGLNGFPWQMSVGATPLRTEFLEAGETTTVNGREVTGPLVISRETEIGEVSFVPLGADGDTSATVSASRGSTAAMNTKALLKFAKSQGVKAAMRYEDSDIDKMTEDEAKAALKECMKSADDEKKDDEAKAKAAEDDEKRAEASAAARIKAARKAEADELTRCDAIKAAVAKHGATHVTLENGQKVLLAAHAIAEGWTADKAELVALRNGRPTAGGPHVHVPGAPEMSEAVLECAVFQAASPTEFRLFDDSFYTADGVKGRGAVPAHLAARVKRELAGRYPDKVQQAAHDHFKGRVTLQRLLATAARANGHAARDVDWSGSDGSEVLRAAAGAHPMHIRADGASNYSLSNLLANVLGKTMLSGYLFVEGAWREVAGVRSVNDFKQTRGINLFGTDIMYDAVGPTGELKNAALSDQAFTNQADQYGKIMTIDRKAIVNDDLGALTTVPMLLGRGAALRLNQTFWGKFLAPGNDDGGSTAFFAATHTIAGQSASSNLITGGTSALSSTSLQLAKQTFDKQVDPAGFPLGVEAEVLLYPTELDQVAWELLNSNFIVAGGGSSVNRQPSENRWRGKYRPVMSRYLSSAALAGNSATAWYMLANPGYMPVIECAFLNGVDVPTVQQAGIDFQFDRLGASVRGVFDFGVNMQNFRGGVKSNGA